MESRLQRDLILGRINRLKQKFHRVGGKLPAGLDDYDRQALRNLHDIEQELVSAEWRADIAEILKLAGIGSYNLDKQRWFALRNKLKIQVDEFADTTKSSSDEKRT